MMMRLEINEEVKPALHVEGERTHTAGFTQSLRVTREKQKATQAAAARRRNVLQLVFCQTHSDVMIN